MTVGRVTGILALALVLASCSGGTTPTSGPPLSDRAVLTGGDSHSVLSVLRGTNYYMVGAHVDGDAAAIEKEIALAVV